MSKYGVPAGVRQVAQLHQVSVIVLASDGGKPSLQDTLAEALAGLAKIIVIDCVDVRDVTASDLNALIETHLAMAASQRQLVVVNAPLSAVPILRKQGVDVASTTDVDYND